MVFGIWLGFFWSSADIRKLRIFLVNPGTVV
jgi:hypothetical protein